MSNLSLLVKNSFINEFQINKIKFMDSKEKGKLISLILLVAISIIVVAKYTFDLCMMLSEFLISANQLDLMLYIGIVGYTVVAFFTSIYKSSAYIFNSKDSDIIFSLPIKKSTILASKILMLEVNSYLYGLIFLIIPAVVYYIKADVSAIFLVFVVGLALVAPFIPIILSSIIGILITNISSKYKNNNLVSIVCNILLVVGIMLVSFNIQSVVTYLSRHSQDIMSLIKNIYPLAYFFVDALKNGSVVSFLIFMTVSISLMALFIHLFSNNFAKISKKLSEVNRENDYELTELKSSSVVMDLFKKELKRYLSSNIYVLNTSIGMVMLVIATGSVLAIGYEEIMVILGMSMAREMMLVQVLGIVVMCIVMTNTTCVSISLEGDNLWIIKSLPIKEMDIFKSKILLNLMLVIPVSVICFILLAMKLDFEVNIMVLALVLIVLLALFNTMLGLFINLLYPKVEFTSDVEIVKRSASMLMNLVCNLGYVGFVCFSLYLFKVSSMSMDLVMANVITFVGVVVVYMLIKNKGSKIFRAIC